MQSDQQFYNINGVPPLSYQVGGGGYINSPTAPTLGVTQPPSSKQSNPFHGVQLQPFEVCPKNFIIFDHTDNRSRVMFHPAFTQKFNYPDANYHAPYVQDNDRVKNTGTENRESSYPLKEDSKDIDALLSLDYEEDEEEYEDEEEVSTARTFGSCSPDSSCSSYGSKPSNLRMSSSSQKMFSCSSSSSFNNSERKRQKMKKMMKALRGIVPGANQMNSAGVLDEAVKYLKSLKVEVKNLGIGNFKE